MNLDTQDRLRGAAVGAAIGDALGMPLEFGPAIPLDRLVREMRPGRLPAGTFTDDTEMALALADSLLECCPLDAGNLSQHFVAWYRAGPSDVGIQTGSVLSRIAGGTTWQAAVDAVQRSKPDAAGNGSVMRCWPVALAHWDDMERLSVDSRLQSRVTHGHPECAAGSAFVNAVIYDLARGSAPREAVRRATAQVALPAGLRQAIEAAPTKTRADLPNSGWVRHTVESAVWGLLTTGSFEEAVVQVVNLGNDADTAGAVVGALAGAAYGLGAIPAAWRSALHGNWPLLGAERWDVERIVMLADRLMGAVDLP
ncbi:MAG: ADP-ribosylglycohydrolase family protein [Anaerolineae bacterium]|jgi:ADP-ribosyl-[dinitrogen reductase] hydrolase|nr:ADP-ribosylglycohydrolase family protein [Anaerolineae bacterium]